LLYGSKLRDDETKAALTGLIEVPGEVEERPLSRMRRRLSDLSDALFERYPPEVTGYDAIRRVLLSHPERFAGFDAVLIEHPGLAPLIELRAHEPWLLTLHNVGSGTLEHRAAMSAGRQRWIYRRQARQARRFERWSLDSFDTVFSVSQDDAALLPKPTVVIPNGVDIDRFEPTPVPAQPRLALIGTLGYLPNVDGALWLADEVLPIVRQHVPGVTLDLVGRLPTADVLNLASRPGVFVHPDVPDVRDYFVRTRVCLVPLRLGTGTRLKALEAFAAYRPVVGTTIGLAGLNVVDGRHAFVADEPRQFAARVVEVLEDDDCADRLVREGRALVEADYSWTRIGEEFAEALTAVVNRRG
jgi:polysaccharide biosynthesis protein PslH